MTGLTPDPLRPGRRLDIEQLLHSQGVGLLVAHHGHIVQPVKVWKGLEEGRTGVTPHGPGALRQPANSTALRGQQKSVLHKAFQSQELSKAASSSTYWKMLKNLFSEGVKGNPDVLCVPVSMVKIHLAGPVLSHVTEHALGTAAHHCTALPPRTCMTTPQSTAKRSAKGMSFACFLPWLLIPFIKL